MLRKRMSEAAARLSDGDRDLLKLVAAGVPPREIAPKIAAPNVNAVYQRIHRASKRFRALLVARGVELEN